MPDLLTGSWLTRMLLGLRKYIDEPSVNAKYADNDLIDKISESWAELWVEINNNNESPIVVRYDMSITTTSLVYLLPANVGRIIRVAKINAVTDLPEWEVDTRNYFNPAGHGWRIEGNVFRLGRMWNEAATVRVDYVPCAEIVPITGNYDTLDEITSTSTTIEVQAATDLGVLDTRPNAYAGYMIRLVPDGTPAPIAGDGKTITQERYITAYNPETRIATVSVAWNPDLGTTDPWPSSKKINYEIIPMHFKLLESVLAIRTAQNICSMEGHITRYNAMMTEYRRKIRSMRLALQTTLGRRASHFEGDIPENRMHSRVLSPFGRGIS